MIATSTRDAYLRRLRLPGEAAGAPSVDGLARIHRAQVEQVPYETTWIHLGERWPLDPMAAVQRIAHGGRGGYCYHVNGALALVLDALGYRVTRHVGGVHGVDDPIEPKLGNHLVLMVHDLPTTTNPGGRWLVDAGLGDGLHDPLPLVAGATRQGPFTFRLAPWRDGWHLDHDELGSFAGVAITTDPVAPADFEECFGERHVTLSTSPESSFTGTATVQRRRADGVDMLRGLVLTSIDHERRVTKATIEDRDEWFALLVALGLRLRVSPTARGRLWSAVVAAHESWAA